MALTRDEIKAKRGIRQRTAVEIPDFGTVYVAKMTAKDRDEFEWMVTGGSTSGVVNTRNVRAKFLALVLVNEDGTKMCEDADAEWLGELDTDVVQTIVDAGFKLNGIGANQLEDATKN